MGRRDLRESLLLKPQSSGAGPLTLAFTDGPMLTPTRMSKRRVREGLSGATLITQEVGTDRLAVTGDVKDKRAFL